MSTKPREQPELSPCTSDGSLSLTHPRHDDKEAWGEVVVDDEGKVLPPQSDLHPDGREGLPVAAQTLKGYDLEEGESKVNVGYVNLWQLDRSQGFRYIERH